MSKVALIILASLLLVGLIGLVALGLVTNWAKSDGETNVSSSTKAVQAICQPADYKEACFKSMSNINTDDPKELVRAAFKSAQEELSTITRNSTVLKELENDPKTAEAVKDCRELFGDAIDDLQRSFEVLGEFEWNKVNKMLANIKVWLSASITYQDTCLDGFENTTGDARHKVHAVLKLALEMTSNGLAIVMDMSSLLSTIDTASFNRRRLLSYLGQRGEGHIYNNPFPYFLDKHSQEDLRRHPDLGPMNRRLLGSGNTLDNEELPRWLGGDRRWLLLATPLAENLKKMANVVVAKDGSGKYNTIEKALRDVPKKGKKDFIIYIKEGVYNEYLVVEKWMTYVVFIGDGPTKTRISNNKNFVDGTKTYKTATLSVTGDFFMAKDIGVENTAGAIKHQAVALRVQADQSIFYNCHMDGYQDTLYVHTYRQFYRNCRVTGTIDFIFGDAAAFFQNCTFVVRKPLPNQHCIVTAQGRMERHQPTGIIIHKSRFEADPEYYPLKQANKAYLGRPWKEYSRTIIMESYIGDFIQPQGWLPWDGSFGLETCYYSEFNNIGPGSSLGHRVKWRGIKTITHDHAERFMPFELFDTDVWIKDTKIPYDPTLSIALAPDISPAEAPSVTNMFFSKEDTPLERNLMVTEEIKPKEPLTISEVERMLMVSEEEIEHKTNKLSPPKSKGPILVEEMERMLMGDEDFYDIMNQTMLSLSPNLAPSSSPSLAPSLGNMPSPNPNPNPSPSPSLAPSIANRPKLAPSSAKGHSHAPSTVEGRSSAPSHAPSTGSHHSPSKNNDDEEVHDWLPPSVGSMLDTEAPAPAPELDVADEAAHANLGSKFKYKFHVILILSGFTIYAIPF